MIFTLKTVTVKGVGTLGVIYSPTGHEICKSVERDWLSNAKNVSCVSEGLYELIEFQSPKFGEVWALVNPALGVTVAGPTHRTHILIHPANYPHELEGCIAAGKSYFTQAFGVSNSRTATKELFQELRNAKDNPTTDGKVFLNIVRSHT